MSTASLGGAKIFGEVRVNLKISFPTFDNETLEVRAKPHKILSQVILHVLQKLQGQPHDHRHHGKIIPFNSVSIIMEDIQIQDENNGQYDI